jgi:hypothetical protein
MGGAFSVVYVSSAVPTTPSNQISPVFHSIMQPADSFRGLIIRSPSQLPPTTAHLSDSLLPIPFPSSPLTRVLVSRVLHPNHTSSSLTPRS